MKVAGLQHYVGAVVVLVTLGAASGCSELQPQEDISADCALWQKEWHRLDTLLSKYDTDYEKTTFLREYCGRLLDVGRPTAETVEFYHKVSYNAFTLCQFYPLFEQDSLPAACGITSYFFIKLAQSFGYKAYQYSFGFTQTPYERFIHSFPLVEIDYLGEKKLIIQDPYLNLTFTDSAGTPLDIYEFLVTLLRKSYETIQMDTGVVATSLLVADTTLYWPYLNDSCRALMSAMLIQPDGSLLKKTPLLRSYKHLMQSSCDHFEEDFTAAMRAHDYNEPFLYAYTLRVNEMAGSSDVKTVQANIDAILRDTSFNYLF